MAGTSNTRQGDKHGCFRNPKALYHTRYHTCCNAVEYASRLTVASIPGLSIPKLGTHRVIKDDLLGGFGGLTLRGVIERMSRDASFNGHFCLWLMDNDIDWIYERRWSMESAVKEYREILSKLFKDIELDRLYITTAPLRKSDFSYERRLRCIPINFRMNFNEELRRVFGNGQSKINGVPVTLVDLNICFPDHLLDQDKFYCEQETNKVHYNSFFYKKFLDLLYSILHKYGGLVESVSVCKPVPSLSAATSSQVVPSFQVCVKPPVVPSHPVTNSMSPSSSPPYEDFLEDCSWLWVPNEPPGPGPDRKTKRGKCNRRFDPFYLMDVSCLD